MSIPTQENRFEKKPPEIDPRHKTEDLDSVHKDILERLQKAANSEARVHTFAKLMDTYGLDPIVSLIPALGDGGATGLAGLYVLVEAKRAGLKPASYLKIIGLQTADFFIGTVPIVGDVADYLWQANKWSARDFEKKTEELIQEAAAAGISQDEIAKIKMAAEKLPRLVENGVAFVHKRQEERAEGTEAA